MHSTISDPTFALVTLLTIFAWVGVMYIVYRMWDRRPTETNPALGYILTMTENEDGLTATGILNDEGVKRMKAGEIETFSLGVQVSDVDATTVDGVKVIKHATLHSASIDHKPGPYGGKIELVDGEELCPHGYPTHEHHNAEGRCSRNPGRFA